MVRKDLIIFSIDGVEQNIDDIISIKFTDKIGSKSDRIDVKVKPAFPRPAVSAKLELIFESYVNDKLIERLNCGYFHSQATTRINNKGLSFTGTGVEFNHKQKLKISHSYKDTKLSNIVNIVAKRLNHQVEFKTDDIFIKSLLQTNETDINFLTRISKDYNVLFSIKNDFIIFVNKDEESLPVRDININSCKNPNLKRSSKEFYLSCRASWHDIDSNKTVTVTFGEGTPLFELTGHFKTKDEAKAKAKAKLIDKNKGIVTGSFSIRGIALYAGTKINITDTYKNEDDGIYSVEDCTHSWNKAGWISNIQFEN